MTLWNANNIKLASRRAKKGTYFGRKLSVMQHVDDTFGIVVSMTFWHNSKRTDVTQSCLQHRPNSFSISMTVTAPIDGDLRHGWRLRRHLFDDVLAQWEANRCCTVMPPCNSGVSECIPFERRRCVLFMTLPVVFFSSSAKMHVWLQRPKRKFVFFT